MLKIWIYWLCWPFFLDCANIWLPWRVIKNTILVCNSGTSHRSCGFFRKLEDLVGAVYFYADARGNKIKFPTNFLFFFTFCSFSFFMLKIEDYSFQADHIFLLLAISPTVFWDIQCMKNSILRHALAFSVGFKRSLKRGKKLDLQLEKLEIFFLDARGWRESINPSSCSVFLHSSVNILYVNDLKENLLWYCVSSVFFFFFSARGI